MTTLPSGTLTFLFSDVERSTQLFDRHPRKMQEALARHDAMVVDAVERNGGHIVKPARAGDSFLAVFDRATNAIDAALALQLALAGEPWPAETPIRVRVALHSGEAEERDEQYYGAEVTRCARLMAIAHGGQTIASKSTCALVTNALPPGVVLLPLGAHRLKDLRRPEDVYQVCHPGLPNEFPPLRSQDLTPNNLPLRLDRFIGREAEIRRVRDWLHTHRIVTLKGPAGVGKSRLALQIAAEESDRHDGGTWLIELASETQPADVARAVAAVLHVRDEPWRSLTDALCSYFGDRSVLLVLDNAEHVAAECAVLAQSMLKCCPGVRVLATSREPLGLYGELVWSLPPLSMDRPIGTDAADEDRPSEAVALFVDRAALIRPDFGLSERDEALATEICRRLDGLPLAIELAARRLDALSLTEMLARLPQRLTILDGRPTTDARHPSLRAAIDLSFENLPEFEQRLFDRLSVFASEFGIEAAEHVAASHSLPTSNVLDGISRLVGKSLLASSEDDGGRTKYRYLETLRLYGQERLRAADELDDALHALADYYAAALAGLEPELVRSASHAIRTVATEYASIREALQWAIRAEETEIALRMSGVLGRYWYVAGRLVEGGEWLRAVLALPGIDAAPVDALAKSLRGQGSLAYALGDSPVAESAYDRSLGYYRSIDDRAGEAQVLNDLAILHHQAGRLDEARHLYGRSLNLKEARHDVHGMANTLANLGLLEQWAGDFGAAESAFRKSLGHAESIGAERVIAEIDLHLAILALARGDVAAALQLGEEGLRRHEAVGDQAGTMLAHVTIGRILRELDDPANALIAVGRGMEIAQEIGYRWGIAMALEIRGKILADAEHWTEARADFEAAKAIWDDIGDRQNVANALDGLGRVALAEGDWRESARHHRDCLITRMRQTGASALMCCVCLEDLAGVFVTASMPGEGARLAGAAKEFRRSAGVPLPKMAERRLGLHLEAMRCDLGDQTLGECLEAGRSTSFPEMLQLALDVAGGLDEGHRDLPDDWHRT